MPARLDDAIAALQAATNATTDLTAAVNIKKSVIDAAAGYAAAAEASADRIDLGALDAAVAATAADRTAVSTNRAAVDADALQTHADATATALDKAAIIAAMAAGSVRSFATTADALSNGVIDYTITAPGTGGTNGSYALAYAGGAGSGATAKVLVAGGALSSVTIQQRGRGYTSAPTISYTITGLTGGAITAIIGTNTVDGDFFTVPDTVTGGLAIYKNVAAAAVFQFLLGMVDDLNNAGGRQSLWPDPFHIDTVVAANSGFRGGIANAFTPYNFGGGAPTWVLSPASAASPYPDGKILTRPAANVPTPIINVYLDRLGLKPGDVIEFSQEMAYQTNVTTVVSSVGVYGFFDGSSTLIGSQINLFPLSAGAGSLTNTPKRFTTGAITIPAGAMYLTLSYTLWGAGAIDIYSTWMHKGSTTAKPTDRMQAPDAHARLKALEGRDPVNNNTFLKRVAYSSVTTVVGPSGPAQNTVSSLAGMGSNFVTASIPAAGFNAIQQIFNWSTASTGPTRIYAQVRTAATGSNALNGKLVAEGWISVDPAALTSDLQNILLHDVYTGLPRTIKSTDNDLSGVYSIEYFGLQAGGAYATGVYVNYATASDGDPTFPGYYIQGVPAGRGFHTLISASTGGYCAANRVLLTTPTVVYLPSITFINAISAKGEQPPDIIALPTKVYGVEGRPMVIYFDAIEHRRSVLTNFRIPAMPYGNFYNDHWEYTPSSTPINQGMTISAYRGQLLVSTASTTIVTAALTASAGNKTLHFIGDSITNSGGYIQSYQALDAADATSSTTYIGTQSTTTANGTYKRDGYSGQGAGSLLGATISGYGANPFYNPTSSTFDYSYYVANSAGGVVSDCVFLAFGTNDMDPASGVLSDDAAASRATGVASVYEAMITSIKAAGVPRVAILSPLPTAGEQDITTNNSRDAFWRFERNLKILAYVLNTQFSGREGAGIHFVGTHAASDRRLEYTRVQVLRNPSVKVGSASPFTNYSTMLGETAAAVGTLAKATDVGQYFVKLANGYWRSATEIDGVIWRVNDAVHHIGNQMGEVVYAFRKCVV